MELLDQITVPLEKKTLKQTLSAPLQLFSSHFPSVFCASVPCILLATVSDFLLQGTLDRFAIRPGMSMSEMLGNIGISVVTLLISLLVGLYIFALSYTLVDTKFHPAPATWKSLFRPTLLRCKKILGVYGFTLIAAIITLPIFFYTYIPLFLVLLFYLIKKEAGQREKRFVDSLKAGFRIGTRYWARLFGTFFVLILLAALATLLSGMPYMLTALAHQAASGYTAHSGMEITLPKYYPILFLFCCLLKNWVYCFACIYANCGSIFYTLSVLARYRLEHDATTQPHESTTIPGKN